MLEGRDITGNNRAWLGLKRAGLVEYVHPIGYLLTDTGRDRARDARNFWPRRW